MANSLTGPVWTVDTAASTDLTVNSDFAPNGRRVILRGVQWISKTATAGDDVEITDGANRRVWASVAAGSNHKEADAMNVACHGLIVPTLDSGYLLLEIA